MGQGALRQPLPSPCLQREGRKSTAPSAAFHPGGGCSHCWGHLGWSPSPPHLGYGRIVGQSSCDSGLCPWATGGTANPAGFGECWDLCCRIKPLDGFNGPCTSLELIFQPRHGVSWSWRDLGSASEDFATKPGAGKRCRVTPRFGQGSLCWVALWAGTGPICGRQTCRPARPASSGAVGLTRLFENATDVMQIQPLLASASCIL